MTLAEAFEMIERGETAEQYKKRHARIRRLTEERDFLQDGIELLGDDPRADKKKARLSKVESMLADLV